MAEPHQQRMTLEEFLTWSERQDGRWELIDGVPVAMAPERAVHAHRKFAMQSALAGGLRTAGVDCRMLPDGMTVTTADGACFEPDALVYCGPEVPGDTIVIENPVIVVEVSSPSTHRIDSGVKLAGYFSIPSVQHYLIIHPEGLPLIHHRRASGDAVSGDILTRIVPGGSLYLDPPGLTLDVDVVFID